MADVLDATEPCVLGKLIYHRGPRTVVEHTRSDGQTVVVKFARQDPRAAIQRSEATMQQFAATHGILTPKVLRVYDIMGEAGPIGRAIVMEKAPGVPLVQVWRELPRELQESIKNQLRGQLALMRLLTMPYIGRVGYQPTWNVFNGRQTYALGPFPDRQSFDEWCLRRIRQKPDRSHTLAKWRLRRHVKKDRARSAEGRFVLTHGDLSPRNIMVEDGMITGIIDWQFSGFFPEWVEHANATVIAAGIEKWWIPVLREVVPQCTKGMSKLAFEIEEQPGCSYGDEKHFAFDD
ncbi:unnamed protein product [Clonostachys rhizophaga]|uniref:Aminoglycoside phosphotransferase domain-containing protein n=1 Tax=Clonostachys rhizophaga TaxID=160324 RepID=A0A9N9VJC2_9HYPO|nr:unnamed protein product [Clonostachys rhizophaga]